MQLGLPLWQYLVIGLTGANLAYLIIGGGIHYYYYHLKRDQADQWKLQPKKFLSKKLAREAAILGTLNYNFAAAVFAVLAWGILEKGWSQMYYNIHDYSYAWAALSVFLCWLFIEACAFYLHALVHIGWGYSKIHYIHHRYTAPTFFTISAMHPLEWILHMSYIILPPFIMPINLWLYLSVVIATFVIGYWDHAGIKMPFDLPFHGSHRFHDDHHKYFHVNFGFTCSLFDRIHDTVRRDGHHYTEESFMGGKGRVRSIEALGPDAIGPRVDYSHTQR